MPPGPQVVGQADRVCDQARRVVDHVDRRRPDPHPAARRARRDRCPRDLQLLLGRVPEQGLGQPVPRCDLRHVTEHAAGHHAAQAYLLHRVGHTERGVQVRWRVVIVHDRGGAGPHRLNGSEPGRRDRLAGPDGGRVGPHEVAEPRPQRHPFADSPGQALKQVVVAVDQPRNDRPARAVDGPPRPARCPGYGADVADPLAGDGHRSRLQDAPLIVDGDHCAAGQ